jgi:beta-glucosidase
VLKGELGFGGFLVSDWLGVSQLDPDFEKAVCLAINAGMDMVMVPYDYPRFIGAVQAGHKAGLIPTSRIDDACRRILSVKSHLGLFDHPFGDETLLSEVGSAAHRAVAREAVRKSQVLLKNDGGVLPISPKVAQVVIAGDAADDIGLQCGGWTIEWQGGRGASTAGTTLLKAVTATVSPTSSVIFSANGEFAEPAMADVGIIVLSEQPYSEGEGDREDLSLSTADAALVHRVRRRCKILVLLIYSGRPLIIAEVLDACDAVVASWLPGTEADGIADVLFGIHPFTGRLPLAWPRDMNAVRSRTEAAPLYPLGYGLTT